MVLNACDQGLLADVMVLLGAALMSLSPGTPGGGLSQTPPQPQPPLPSPPAPLTCQDGPHVVDTASLDDAPLGALRQVQQVVVHPETHQHLDGELQHLGDAGQGGTSSSVCEHLLSKRFGDRWGCVHRRRKARTWSAQIWWDLVILPAGLLAGQN